MKRLLDLCFALVLMLTCLTSCDLFGKDKGVTCKEYDNCAVFTFDDFSIGETASFKLARTGLGEGAIYYQINLEEGVLDIGYKDTGYIHQEQKLGEFSADGEMPVNASGGYIEGDKITVTFYSNSPVSGEIIIAFTEDALKAVHGNLKIHQHTCEYEIREDAHKKIYTCDCTYLEERDFELHYDDNKDGKCDECEFYIGIPHEDHSWGYDVNEASHRQIFGCGCESPEDYEAHYNYDGDNLCDACGYDMSEHEHTITYISAGISGHFENFTCGCPHDHGAVPHYDENDDYICDGCEYVMSETSTNTGKVQTTIGE